MDKKPIDEMVNKLWELTKVDWHVRIDHTLTEPTCPTCDIFSDLMDDGPRIDTVFGNSIEEAIYRAVELMIERIEEKGIQPDIPNASYEDLVEVIKSQQATILKLENDLAGYAYENFINSLEKPKGSQ